MIITSSTVSMATSYSYKKTESVQEVSVATTKGQAATLELTGTTEEKMKQLKEYEEKAAAERQSETTSNLLSNQNAKKVNSDNNDWLSKDELQDELLKKILEMLRSTKKGKLRPIDLTKTKQLKLDTSKKGIDLSNLKVSSDLIPLNKSTVGTVFTKTTVTSSFIEESETSAFTSTGVVKTADGREINFGIQLEMSRSFTAQYESFSQADYIVCDPLVINLSTDTASVTDQKFMFDIDSDGEEDSISFTGEGSGFLALDKNQDGTINDGSELFGTKSGNGFEDLSAYDGDGNGWIDEADDVFANLKIWTKDEEGNDKLINLKEAGVGAIYLGNATTQFSLNDEQNQTNGIIRKTGVYLRESGEVGTVQHLDLTI